MGAGGDTGSWWYNQYKDLPTNGLYLNNFYFQADQLEKGKGYFIEALGRWRRLSRPIRRGQFRSL